MSVLFFGIVWFLVSVPEIVFLAAIVTVSLAIGYATSIATVGNKAIDAKTMREAVKNRAAHYETDYKTGDPVFKWGPEAK